MSAVLETATDATGVVVGPSEEDLHAVTSDVWACFLGEELDAGVGLGGDAGETVLACVGITGAWGGHVLLELPVGAARAAAARMLGADGADDLSTTDVVDALAELVNMVGGNVKSLLPGPSHLGLPLVVGGALAPAGGSATVETCRVDLASPTTSVRVRVWATHDLPDRGTAA